MVKWSSAVLNELVAPDITKFVSATIPDLSMSFPGIRHWMWNYFANSSPLRRPYKDGPRQLVGAFVRRIHRAFRCYHDALDKTHAYLRGNEPFNPRVGAYFDCLDLWEHFCLQTMIALGFCRDLTKRPVFSPGDGSVEQRIWALGNAVKHTAGDPTPLWLTNDGLRSNAYTVTFEEAAELLQELTQLAEDLLDPLTASDKLNRCRAVTRSGHRCKRHRSNGRRACWQHD